MKKWKEGNRAKPYRIIGERTKKNIKKMTENKKKWLNKQLNFNRSQIKLPEWWGYVFFFVFDRIELDFYRIFFVCTAGCRMERAHFSNRHVVIKYSMAPLVYKNAKIKIAKHKTINSGQRYISNGLQPLTTMADTEI